MKSFELKILKLNWKTGIDDSFDFCAHGDVYVRVGEEIVSDHKSGNWTVSSTGLYLLRTLENNYHKTQYGSQILPCCGFSMFEDPENPGSVFICGCNIGIDWAIEHIDSVRIKHTTEQGAYCVQDLADFKQEVIQFVREVEQFYQISVPKKLPEDTHDRKMYANFWREWNALKERNDIQTGILISSK